MFHVSDVQKFGYCPKFFWLVRQEGPKSPQKFIQMSQSLTDILVQKLGLSDVFEGYRSIDPQLVIDALNQHKAVVNGRFEHHGLRVKIPLVHWIQDGLEVIFTTMGPQAKVEDQRYYANHLWVLQGLVLPIASVKVMSFNPDYVRGETLDIDACFVFRDTFVRSNGKPAGNITAVLKAHPLGLDETLLAMKEVDENEAMTMTIDQCPGLNRCEYFETCFDKQFDLGNDSIFFLTQSANKRAFISEGLRRISEVPLDRLEGTALQYAQLMADRNGGVFADTVVLKHWLASLTQPLIFMDFEWDTHGIPPYQGMRPLDVLCFQYSLHILKDQDLSHYEFLEAGDCRERFIRSLIDNTPKTGSILAYNAFGAEALRLNELGEQFPQYQEELKQIVDRMVDLAELFTEGIVYISAMKGSFTLKNIIQVIKPELNYAQLSIGHGLEAVKHYRTLQNNDDEDEIKDALLKYCKMDTLAMVEILAWLSDLVA